jgi:pimeloyl-ACP methyl ester carboxylesterase
MEINVTSKRLQLNHVNLHYLDYGGTGPLAVLLLHGGGAHAHWFDFIGPSLTQHGRIIAVDLRGHGDSTPVDPPVYTYDTYLQDLRALLQAEQISTPVLLGHSMGGILAVKYAGTWPQEMQALIVCDSRPVYSPEAADFLRRTGQYRGREYTSEEDYVARFRIRPEGLRAPQKVHRYIARHAGRQSSNGQWVHKIDRQVYAQREAINTLPFWQQITCPTLFLHAEQGSRLTPKRIQQVQEACPQVGFAEVADAGHHLMLDQPDQTVALVKAFFQDNDFFKTEG